MPDLRFRKSEKIPSSNFFEFFTGRPKAWNLKDRHRTMSVPEMWKRLFLQKKRALAKLFFLFFSFLLTPLLLGFFVRQFYFEGFVIQFLVSSISADGKTMILDSESNENIPKDMRSRITYKILNNNEFTETYEIAEPGKDFGVYWVKHFKRKTE